MFVIASEGRNSKTLFLVDRRIEKNHWWSLLHTNAFVYKNLKSAEEKAKSLRYRNVRVMTFDLACEIGLSQLGDFIEDQTHPFDTEALGQD